MAKLENNSNRNLLSTYIKLFMLLIMFSFLVFALYACGSDNSKKINTIKVEQKRISLVVGGTEQLTITIEPSGATNSKVFYTSTNSSVATVNQSGLITAISVGETTVSITAEDGGASALVVVEVVAEPITLQSPQNVKFDGEKITWDRVDHNYGY